MVATPEIDAVKRVAFKRGFLTEPLDDLSAVRFTGSRCRDCGVALLGERRRCENCASRNVEQTTFETRGVVHSVTVQRYPPPAPFVGPTPWVPRAIAWIDLDGRGPRIMAPVSGPADAVGIGARVRVEFVVGWSDEEGREVVSFVFHPEGAGAG
jgi:uncharacterized OB-fold protein